MHIQALVAEELTVEPKYPELKSVNTAKHYTENEYNSYLFMLKSPELRSGNWVFLGEVEYMGTIQKVYMTIFVSPNSFRGKKQRRKPQVRKLLYI